MRLVVFYGVLILLGIGMVIYLYNRFVFDVMDFFRLKCFLWSLFGIWMFNFGFLMFWVICKEIFLDYKVI